MRKTGLLFAFLSISTLLFAQKKDSTRYFSGVLTATNNGISLLPNFSLNKPALLFDVSLGKKRLSFDPMIRFAAEGKPWAFIFWGRYKLFANPKFKMSIGAHPSVVFRSVSLTDNGVSKEYLTAQRYFASELTPTYFINKRFALGGHYLYSHGLTKDITQHTHFMAFRVFMNNLPLSKELNLTLIPQIYHLKMDAKKGSYVNGTILLTKKNAPIGLSSIVSKALKTDIAGKDFVWNIGLTYNFNHQYIKK